MGLLEKCSTSKSILPKKTSSKNVLESAQTVISFACNYFHDDTPTQKFQDSSRARLSRYAQGDDYHLILKDRLKSFRSWLLTEGLASNFEQTRVYVDTGPLLERELAWRAGLGWFGKHSNLIHPKLGSWLLLAEVLIDKKIPPDQPFSGIDCGSCTRCIDACPTEAIVRDRSVDARRCLSYLTIELKNAIPEEFRPKFQNWIFGCDICQEVCPWNRKAPCSHDSTWKARKGLQGKRLWDWIRLKQHDFSYQFQKSAVKRTKRRGLLRNVVTALGGCSHPQALSGMQIGLKDEEELVRQHSAWALGFRKHRLSKGILWRQLRSEASEEVIREIQQALTVKANNFRKRERTWLLSRQVPLASARRRHLDLVGGNPMRLLRPRKTEAVQG
jgi:epoxyqueuosine reductase